MSEQVAELLGEFVKGLDDAAAVLRKEADDGDLYSGLQADVIDPISKSLKEILEVDCGTQS